MSLKESCITTSGFVCPDKLKYNSETPILKNCMSLDNEFGICSHKKKTNCVKLDVIAVISNPVRFNRRYELFTQFCERVRQNPYVRLLTVELQQGTRPFITDATVKYRTKHELWYKENLINLGVRHLPFDWEYVAWVDSDIHFQNKNWAEETVEQLQTYDVVQMFSHAIDLGPNGETLQVHAGFMFQYLNEEKWPTHGYGVYRHPGFAWACTKKAYDHMGGLIEFSIFGSADYHMAAGLIGEMERTLHPQIHKNYKELCYIFEERCERHIKRNVGYVKGTILHEWHSCKSRRQYASRPGILAKLKFDPNRDLKKDHQGLWQLEDINIQLRDEIRRYFRARLEDSIDLFQDYRYTKKEFI